MAFLALIIVVVVVEIWVIIQVAHAIGALDTIALLILVSIVGAYLTKHEGFVVLRRVREQLGSGRVPAAELVDGLLVLAAGVLLLVPGFVTAGLGLLILFPPTRALFRGVLRRRFDVRVYRGGRGPENGPGVIDV